MPDILIRGMRKPTSCDDCPMYTCMHNFDDCPLVELPPHGDLIDRKELCDGLVSNHPVVIYANTAPVIVPASEEETNHENP